MLSGRSASYASRVLVSWAHYQVPSDTLQNCNEVDRNGYDRVVSYFLCLTKLIFS